MAINHELNRLGGKIDALKNASMFEAKTIAESALMSAMRVLIDMDTRIQELEKQAGGKA